MTDLNGQGQGGVPALFKSFTQQAALDYDVSLETQGGAGLDYHLKWRLGVIGRRRWDVVVMHGFSTLDYRKPKDPALLVATSKQMADFLRGRNPAVQVYLMATFPRADQTYPDDGAWHGEPIEAMARDVRAGYDQAAEAAKAKAVIPVGDAWIRAMHDGVADPNPYDGIEAGKLDLWAPDHYHASAYGNYLQALVIFGAVTGHDRGRWATASAPPSSWASRGSRRTRCSRWHSSSSRARTPWRQIHWSCQQPPIPRLA